MSVTARPFDRLTAFIMLATTIWVILMPTMLSAQEVECGFLAGKPSLEHARSVFREADLDCAQRELMDLLAQENLPFTTRAEAHVLMASIIYISESDDTIKRRKVKKELLDAFLADRRWQGRLEIATPDFRAMMNDARELAEWRYKNSPELQQRFEEQTRLTDSSAADAAAIRAKSGKPWYTRWWAIGSGVGLVAMAVLIMSGGNSEPPPPPPLDSLPGFPSTP